MEINTLPKALRDEVSDFIEFLKKKAKTKSKLKKREFGCMKGKIKLSEDFDAPLDEFKGYM